MWHLFMYNVLKHEINVSKIKYLLLKIRSCWFLTDETFQLFEHGLEREADNGGRGPGGHDHEGEDDVLQSYLVEGRRLALGDLKVLVHQPIGQP